MTYDRQTCGVLYKKLLSSLNKHDDIKDLITKLQESRNCDSVILSAQFQFVRDDYIHDVISKYDIASSSSRSILESHFKRWLPYIRNSLFIDYRKNAILAAIQS